MKTELVYQRRFATREEAREAIFEFIEVFYNRQRRHSSIGYLSPVNVLLEGERRREAQLHLFGSAPAGTVAGLSFRCR